MPYLGSAVSKSTDIKRITFATTTTGSGPFALGWTPASENTLRVTVNGVVQQDSSITLSGANLTLVGVTLVSGDELEVQGIVNVGAMDNIPMDGSVTEGKIGGGAVTAAKIGSGAVTSAKIGADAVGASAIATGAVGASEIAANSITVAQMSRAGTSGQLLTSAGTGADAAWSDAPAGGLTHASTWRLNTSFTGTGDVTANLEPVDDPVGFGIKGSAMGETSGIYDFPVTGIWLIRGHFYYWQNGNGGSYYGTGHLNTTTNDSTYAEAAQCRTSDYYSSYGSMTVEYIFDVEDIADCKCKFGVTQGNSSAQIVGHTDINKTYFTFLRLADRP